MAVSSGLKCSFLRGGGGGGAGREGEKRGGRKKAYKPQETYKAKEVKLPMR